MFVKRRLNNINVNELNREQLTTLKQGYVSELVDEGTFAEVFDLDIDEPSYMFLILIDNFVSDEFIKEHYSDVWFTEEDFA